jgi:hypothetical protein
VRIDGDVGVWRRSYVLITYSLFALCGVDHQYFQLRLTSALGKIRAMQQPDDPKFLEDPPAATLRFSTSSSLLENHQRLQDFYKRHPKYSMD